MQVKNLLELMATLSIGVDNLTVEDSQVFLKYLNLANLDLYQATAILNQDLFFNETLSTPDVKPNIVSLSKRPFSMISIFDMTRQRKLPQSALANLFEDDPGFSRVGNPQKYFLRGQSINFWPTQSKGVTQINCWYIPEPSELALNTDEHLIPYPLVYHPVLVDGALYYLFLEESGFRNSQKENEAKLRWERGKSKIISYLYNKSNTRISTFSNV